MMLFIDIIQYSLVSIFGLLLGYQLLLSLLALKTNKISNYKTEKNRKFAIVLPAHDEAKILSKTLYSLFGLVYHKNLYDVIVVADNCNDKTAQIARDMGAIVLERDEPEKRGKGYALRWGFEKILKGDEEYDAVIVFDSDSLVSGNYLDVMNYYLDNGSKVIQSSDLVLPQPGVWSSETTRIGFLLYNLVKPLGRKTLGFSMGLRGNGMCFKTEVLRDIPWQALSLTEDVEYGLLLQLEGLKIDFTPEAVVWAQMPNNPENAESQRKRWEIGRYPIIKKYAPQLLKAAFKKRSLSYIDSFINLITPPLVNTLLIVTLISTLNFLAWAIGWLPIMYFWLWVSVAVMGAMHLFIGLYAANADREVYKSLIYIPVYVFWKIKVYLKAIVSNGKQQWIRTTRES